LHAGVVPEGGAVTEAEWLASVNNPFAMLDFLEGRASERKLRLCAVACCRRIPGIEEDRPCCRGLDAAERYADGVLSNSQRQRVERALLKAMSDGHNRLPQVRQGPNGKRRAQALKAALQRAAAVRWTLVVRDKRFYVGAANCASTLVQRNGQLFQLDTYRDLKPPQMAEWCQALREIGRAIHDVMGPLPFRKVPVQEMWMANQNRTAEKLCQAIYDDRAFDRLSILADALEEAGCTDTDILDHCRGPGPHVRGCWVVDLLLGKE
jgi:hypothetical protein